MKKLFYFGIIGIVLFEIAHIYFIMPMPGSQQINSIDLAYFLYSWRWVYRITFGSMAILFFFKADWKRKWFPVSLILLTTAIIYVMNFVMSADKMFLQTKQYGHRTKRQSINPSPPM